MPPRAKDKTGMRFGKLVVVRRDHTRNGTFWLCQCDCGSTTSAPSGHLNNGSRKSCGCAQDGSHTRTHGMSHSSEYRAWTNARHRCTNPNNRKYPLYGGRGIRMCAQWALSFDTFIRDMGRKPTARHTLERLDSNGDYTPENCVWATAIQQNNNRSFNRKLQFQGRLVTVAQASRATGIPHGTIISRLDSGKSDEEALSNAVCG